jgi:hypothetical protein
VADISHVASHEIISRDRIVFLRNRYIEISYSFSQKNARNTRESCFFRGVFYTFSMDTFESTGNRSWKMVSLSILIGVIVLLLG